MRRRAGITRLLVIGAICLVTAFLYRDTAFIYFSAMIWVSCILLPMGFVMNVLFHSSWMNLSLRLIEAVFFIDPHRSFFPG